MRGLKNHLKNLKKSHNVQNMQPHHIRPWEHRLSKKKCILNNPTAKLSIRNLKNYPSHKKMVTAKNGHVVSSIVFDCNKQNI